MKFSTEAGTAALRRAGPATFEVEELLAMVDGLPLGVAVLTEDLQLLHANRSGGAILDARSDPSVARAPDLAVPHPRGRASGDGGRPGRGEYSDFPFETQGRRLLLRTFRSATEPDIEPRQTTQRMDLLSQVAARVARAESLDATLETVAEWLLESTGMTACAAIVFNGEPVRLRVVGTAGLPGNYAERFRRALGAGNDALPAVAAFRRRRTVVVDRALRQLDRLEDLDGDVEWRSIASFPMVARNHAVGAIKTFWPGPPPDGDELRFLAAVANQAAIAVDNARLFADAAASSRRDEKLIAAGLALVSELSLPAVLAVLAQLACDVADARHGAVGVLGPDGRLQDLITHGIPHAQRDAVGCLPIGRGIHAGISFLGVPITVRGRVYGTVHLTARRGGTEFTESDELAVVTLASQAGVAIENAQLFNEARRRLVLEARHLLARELHDSVCQALFSMTLETRAAQLLLERAALPADGPLAERLRNLRQLTQGAHAEMRALIFELRPDALREEGLAAALRKQAEGVAARAEIAVEVRVPKKRIPLPGEVEEQVYRVVQEALANVAKHSRASKATVRLRHRRTERPALLVEIADDGAGFEPCAHQPGHLGLRTMAQRVERLGGVLRVDTAPGNGTRVSATVPLPSSGSRAVVRAGTQWPRGAR